MVINTYQKDIATSARVGYATRSLTRSYVKTPLPSENETQENNTNTPLKTSITKRLRTGLRSVGVTTVIHLVW